MINLCVMILVLMRNIKIQWSAINFVGIPIPQGMFPKRKTSNKAQDNIKK